jgi:hypothetical protein
MHNLRVEKMSLNHALTPHTEKKKPEMKFFSTWMMNTEHMAGV